MGKKSRRKKENTDKDTIGMNDPCPCRSGKKYKKCCKDKTAGQPRRAADAMQLEYQGERMIGAGKTVYRVPMSKTFHEFLQQHYFTKKFDKEWKEEQEQNGSRHPVWDWIQDANKPQSMPVYERENVFSTHGLGGTMALLQFAYNMYVLDKAGVLPDRVLRDLKNGQQFPGAWYEIQVAAWFMRAGFDIEWLTYHEEGQTMAEFIATHKITRDKFVVEAKSRRREGVMRQKGAPINPTDMKKDLEDIFSAATKKDKKGLPFLIFIDLNLPDDEDWWRDDVQRLVDAWEKRHRENIDIVGFIFTNMSTHHELGAPVSGNSAYQMIILPHAHVHPEYTNWIEDLKKVLDHYGDVPALFDGQ